MHAKALSTGLAGGVGACWHLTRSGVPNQMSLTIMERPTPQKGFEKHGKTFC